MSGTPTTIRRALQGATLGMALLLGGCASVYRVDNQVQSFASWSGSTAPAVPQTYRFERLPSQREGQAGAAQNELEDLARAALARTGWTLADPASAAPWTVQVSASALKLPRAPWEEPWDSLGPGVGWGLNGVVGGRGGALFMRMDIPYHERRVALVVRQAGTGQVVYETRARHDGRWTSSPELWSAMLDAALRDFPNPPAGTRQVDIEVPR